MTSASDRLFHRLNSLWNISVVNLGALWIFFFATAWFCGVAYHNNDDFDMVMIVKQIAPFDASSFILYSSSYLGILYSFLYQKIGILEWYPVLYTVFVSYAFALVFHICCFRSQQFRNSGIAILLFFLALLGLKLLTEVQFTYAAGILSATGWIALFYHVLNRNNSGKYVYISACVLLLLSGWYRYDFFLLIAAFSLPVWAYILWKNRSEYFPFTVKKLTILGLFWAIPVLLPVALQQLAPEKRNPEVKEYLQSQAARGRIHDYALFERASNAEKVMEAGLWTDTERTLFFNWMMPDVPAFSTNNLQKMIRSAETSSWYSASRFFSLTRMTLNDKFFKNQLFLYYLLLSFLLYLIFPARDSAIRFFVFTAFLLMITALLAFFFKMPPSRVSDILFVYAFLLQCLFCFSLNKTPVNGIQLNVISILFCAVLFISVIQGNRYSRIEKLMARNAIHELDDKLSGLNASYIISVPENYPAYFHDCHFRNEPVGKRPVIYHTGPFFNHPANKGYRAFWMKDSMQKALTSGRVFFYFASRNQEQSRIIRSNFSSLIKKYWQLKSFWKEVPLGKDGFVLQVSSDSASFHKK
ncbi:MAG: hypothetical protein JNL57_01000 [Bacteroidetes bacterium]|nr:hypothetical protein [Bacteroidota bacterium]